MIVPLCGRIFVETQPAESSRTAAVSRLANVEFGVDIREYVGTSARGSNSHSYQAIALVPLCLGGKTPPPLSEPRQIPSEHPRLQPVEQHQHLVLEADQARQICRAPEDVGHGAMGLHSRLRDIGKRGS